MKTTMINQQMYSISNSTSYGLLEFSSWTPEPKAFVVDRDNHDSLRSCITLNIEGNL